MGGPSYSPGPGFGEIVNRLANPPNPYETLGNTAKALDAAKQFQANQAVANAYKQAVDPTTGQVDQGRWNALVSQGPGAYNMGAAMQSIGAGVANQAQGTSADVKAKLDQLAVQQAYMQPLTGKAFAGTATWDDINNAMKSAPPGIITPQMASNLAAQQAQGADPNSVIKGGYFASGEAREQLSAQQPHFGTIDTGPMIYPTQGNIAAPGGMNFPTQGMPKGMTPGEVTQTNWQLMQPKEPWRAPDGTMHGGSVADWMRDFGLNPAKVYYDPGAGTVSAPGAPTISVGPGEQAGAPAPSGAPGPRTTPQPPGPGQPTNTNQPTPSAAGGPTTSGGGKPVMEPGVASSSVDAYNAAVRDLPQSQARVTTANLALQSLQGAEIGGKGTEALQALNNALGSYPTELVQKIIPGWDPKVGASDYQTAAKYMQMITNANIPGGQGTNEKLAAAAAATPNPHMQDMAARQVLQTMISGEKMQQYVVQQFQKTGLPPAQYQQWSANWAVTHDPRAFMLDHMTPAQQAYLQKSIKPGSPEEKIFDNTARELMANGVIPDPTRKPGAPAASGTSE